MLLEIDYKEGIVFANNYSVSRCTGHNNVKQYFQCEGKEEGLIRIYHVSDEENNTDLFIWSNVWLANLNPILGF